jgi:hypothetical protein
VYRGVCTESDPPPGQGASTKSRQVEGRLLSFGDAVGAALRSPEHVPNLAVEAACATASRRIDEYGTRYKTTNIPITILLESLMNSQRSQIGVIGLGRMGANIVRRLQRGGHQCLAYDVDAAMVARLAAEGLPAIGSRIS